MSTLIIYCSYRRKGNTSILIKFIKSIKKNCSVINLGHYNIEYYNYRNRYNSTDFLFIVEKMLNYDNIIFMSPVYWYTVSAELKVFIDRFSDLLTVHKSTGKKLKGRNIYLVTQGFFAKKDPELASFLKKTCNYMGMNFKKYEHIGIKNDGLLKNTMKEKMKKFLLTLS
jgi:multimeric flavodoxin WrbA